MQSSWNLLRPLWLDGNPSVRACVLASGRQSQVLLGQGRCKAQRSAGRARPRESAAVRRQDNSRQVPFQQQYGRRLNPNHRFIQLFIRLRDNGIMKPAHLTIENANTAKQQLTFCAECGWPGVGNMPAGVRTLSRNGRRLLVGQLSYFRIDTKLCSLCQEMMAAVECRSWFIKAHKEYLNQIRVKKQLLAGR